MSAVNKRFSSCSFSSTRSNSNKTCFYFPAQLIIFGGHRARKREDPYLPATCDSPSPNQWEIPARSKGHAASQSWNKGFP